MSPKAKNHKVEATKRFKAQVIMTKNGSDARRTLAESMAREHELSLIPPYNDLRVIAGQGTTGLEIFEQCPDVGTVGGGGLIAGVAYALKKCNPDIQIIGVRNLKMMLINHFMPKK